MNTVGKKLSTLLLVFVLFLLPVSAVPNPGHRANNISGGEFDDGDGNFEFPSTVDVLADVDTFYVDAAGDDVGFGTADPDAALHVQGGACVDDDGACTDPGDGSLRLEKNSGSATPHVWVYEDANDGGRIMFDNTNTGWWGMWGDPDNTAADGRFNFFYDDDEVAGGVLNTFSTFGDGDALVARHLTVGDGSTDDGNVTVVSTAGRMGSFAADDAGNYVHIGSSTNHDFVITRADVSGVVLGDTGVTIDPTGVNKDIADSELHVVGGVCVDTDGACTDPGDGAMYVAVNMGVGVDPSANTAIYGSASNTGVWGQGGTFGVAGTGAASGVYGSGTDHGVYGVATGSGDEGVYGVGDTGVYGSGTDYGLYGEATGADDDGVRAIGDTGVYADGVDYSLYGAAATTSVYGTGSSYAVYGAGGATGTYGSGTTHGVYGIATGASDEGGYFRGDSGVYASGVDYGVYGIASGASSTAVWGSASGFTSTGVYGWADQYGVFGTGAGTGVYASAGNTGSWSYGANTGAYATSAATAVYGLGDAVGVAGADTAGNQGTIGNTALNAGVTGTGGVYGAYGLGATGVYGSGSAYGIYGLATGSGDDGVRAVGDTGIYADGADYSVFGAGAVTGIFGSGTTYSGYFLGGTFQVGGSIDGVIDVVSSDSRIATLEADDSGNYLHVGSESGHDFAIVRNDDLMVYLDNNGVGMGTGLGATSWVDAELHVHGAACIDDDEACSASSGGLRVERTTTDVNAIDATNIYSYLYPPTPSNSEYTGIYSRVINNDATDTSHMTGLYTYVSNAAGSCGALCHDNYGIYNVVRGAGNAYGMYISASSSSGGAQEIALYIDEGYIISEDGGYFNNVGGQYSSGGSPHAGLASKGHSTSWTGPALLLESSTNNDHWDLVVGSADTLYFGYGTSGTASTRFRISTSGAGVFTSTCGDSGTGSCATDMAEKWTSRQAAEHVYCGEELEDLAKLRNLDLDVLLADPDLQDGCMLDPEFELEYQDGEVVCLDTADPQGEWFVTHCDGSYDRHILSTVSYDATMIIGSTQYPYPIAIAGNAPVWVECKDHIYRGDLIVSSAKPGFAKKLDYDDDSITAKDLMGTAFAKAITGCEGSEDQKIRAWLI